MMRAAGATDEDFLIWRLVTSPHITDSFHVINTHWTLADMARGHLALDVIEVLEPQPEPPKKPRGKNG